VDARSRPASGVRQPKEPRTYIGGGLLALLLVIVLLIWLFPDVQRTDDERAEPVSAPPVLMLFRRYS
jgi:hypothetical protein